MVVFEKVRKVTCNFEFFIKRYAKPKCFCIIEHDWYLNYQKNVYSTLI
jgi:hypothetical protein